MRGAVAHVERYKRGFFFSHDFVGDSSWNGYENNCLFTNLAEHDPGRFSDIARPAGADAVEDARSAVAADLDGDGALDLVIANNGAPPTLLRNRLASGRSWVRFRLESANGPAGTIGARVRLEAGKHSQTRWIEAGSGYASQAPGRAHFGLGDLTAVDAVEVTWPSGRIDRFDRAALDDLGGIGREVTLIEGTSDRRHQDGRMNGSPATAGERGEE